MLPLGVIEADPVSDQAPGCEAIGALVPVERFVVERASSPLDEDVVYAPVLLVHRDTDASRR